MIKFLVDAGEQTEIPKRDYISSLLIFSFGMNEEFVDSLTDPELQKLYLEKTGRGTDGRDN